MTRRTRRAAVYMAASSVHCKGEDSKEAARVVLRIDPDFSIKAFVVQEPYRDREQRKRLQADLAAAGLPA